MNDIGYETLPYKIRAELGKRSALPIPRRLKRRVKWRMKYNLHVVRFTNQMGHGASKTYFEDRYDPERIPNPNIQVHVYDGEMQEAKKEDLYGLYDYNLNHRQRKNANLYFEYMVSDYDPSKTQEIAEYLHQKLEGRPVFIVEHMDEAHYHTHFLVFEKDEQHPRSMNLKRQIYAHLDGISAK